MNLKEATFSAGRWTGASTALVALINALQLFILARLLQPGDFGQMAVVSSLLALVVLIADFGLNQAVIRFGNIPDNHLSSLFTLNVAASILLMLGLILAAPALGMAYRSEALPGLLQTVSISVPVLALGQQTRAVAARDLRFNRLAVVDILSAVAGCAAAVCVGALGGGAYALAIGVLAASFTSTAGTLTLISGNRPAWRFNHRDVQPYLGFGTFLVGDRLTSTAAREADVFVSSLILGPAAVGMYSVPRDLCLRIGTAINATMVKIGFPVMAKVAEDKDRVRSIYLQALRMTVSINAPVFVFVTIYAEQIVLAFFGPQWHGTGIYLRILALWGLIRATANPVGSLLYSTGRTKQAFLWNSALVLTLPAIYWLAVIEAGLLGLALCVTGMQVLLVFPVWKILVQPTCNANLGAYIKQIFLPISLAVLSALPAFGISHLMAGKGMAMVFGGIVYGVAYLALSWTFNRSWLNGIMKLLRFQTKAA